MCDLQLMAETKQLTGHEVRREISKYFTDDRVAKMLTVFSVQVSGRMKHLLNSTGHLSNLDEQSKYFLTGVSIVPIVFDRDNEEWSARAIVNRGRRRVDFTTRCH